MFATVVIHTILTAMSSTNWNLEPLNVWHVFSRPFPSLCIVAEGRQRVWLWETT